MAMISINEQWRHDRGFQHTAPGQRGSLLIVAIILIVIVSLLSAIITSLFSGRSRADIDNTAAAKALYLAESGLERGIREWSLNPGTYVGEGPLAFGAGTFTVLPPDDLDFSGAPLPANRKHITSTGTVPVAGGNAMRTFEAIVESSAGGGGNMLTNNGFDDPGVSCPPEPTDWNVTPDWTGTDCNAVALGGGASGLPGDTAVFSQKAGGGPAHQTIATQNLSTTCTTTAASTFTVTFDYRYIETPAAGGANRGRLRMYLGTAGGWRQSGWLTVNNTTAGWVTHPGLTINVPAGQSLVRFETRIDTSGNVNKTFSVDNIVVTGGTCATTTQVIAWQEVVS